MQETMHKERKSGCLKQDRCLSISSLGELTLMDGLTTLFVLMWPGKVKQVYAKISLQDQKIKKIKKDTLKISSSMKSLKTKKKNTRGPWLPWVAHQKQQLFSGGNYPLSISSYIKFEHMFQQ
jgi:hypothetical protein